MTFQDKVVLITGAGRGSIAVGSERVRCKSSCPCLQTTAPLETMGSIPNPHWPSKPCLTDDAPRAGPITCPSAALSSGGPDELVSWPTTTFWHEMYRRYGNRPSGYIQVPPQKPGQFTMFFNSRSSGSQQFPSAYPQFPMNYVGGGNHSERPYVPY